MEFVELNYQENSATTVALIDQDTKLKEPAALKLPDKKVSLGIKVAGQIVTRLVGSIFFNSFQIELLATNPDYRNQGYGGRLLDFALEMAKQQGVHFVTLETMSFNAPQFYLKHGFEILKEVRDSPVVGTSHFLMFQALR